MSNNLALKDISLAELKELRAAAERDAKSAQLEMKEIDAELVRRYGQAGKEKLLEAGKNHGTLTFEQEGAKLKFELKQAVTWDGDALREIARSMDMSQIDHLFDIKFSVPEAKFNALMPGNLRDRIARARTTKPGDAKITFAS